MNTLNALIGGMLIGTAALLLWALAGRIAGINGITFGSFGAATGDRLWRYCFLFGLILGGWLMVLIGVPKPIATLGEQGFPVVLTLISGLIVGIGTRIGSGCTSGHGICGLSRLSRRSLAAVVVFMGSGMLVATWIRPALVTS